MFAIYAAISRIMIMFDLVSLIQIGGYLGLFIIIFAESGLFFGFFLPGDSLLFTAGFLASQGYLYIPLLVALLFSAAALGDTAGYAFGKYYGPKIFSKEKSTFFNPSHIKKTSEFFRKYGVKTIMLARFIPVIRTFAPIMAGVGEMPYKTFIKYNLIGAALWTGGMTLAGYYFGQTVPNADQYIWLIVGIIIAISFIPPIREYLKVRK